MTLLFQPLNQKVGLIPAASILAALSLGLAVSALLTLTESFGRNLDFIEE